MMIRLLGWDRRFPGVCCIHTQYVPLSSFSSGGEKTRQEWAKNNGTRARG